MCHVHFHSIPSFHNQRSNLIAYQYALYSMKEINQTRKLDEIERALRFDKRAPLFDKRAPG